MAPPVVFQDALACVGETPLIRLNRIPQARGVKCNVLVKCEFFNPGGSVKDRIVVRMIEQAERQGRLIPGKSIIVEPTSGNTGTGLAMAAAIKGYQCRILMPMRMSREKANTMQALGAEVIRTENQHSHRDDPLSHFGIARRMCAEDPNCVMLDQYSNPDNPLAHETTAEEIIAAVANGSHLPKPQVPSNKPGSIPVEVLLPNPDHRPFTPEGSPPPSHSEMPRRVDAFVAGVGTGGTISGIGKRLKQQDYNPACIVVGVDPIGSTMAEPSSINTVPQGHPGKYTIEGIGHNFDPAALHKQYIDTWVKTDDAESFAMTREIIRTEGLLVGGSSGAAVLGAMRWLQKEAWEEIGSREDKTVVILLSDGIRNYLTKDWLLDDGQHGKRSMRASHATNQISNNIYQSGILNIYFKLVQSSLY